MKKKIKDLDLLGNSKIKTPPQDIVLKVFSFILLIIGAVALLFPIYWMMSSASKTEAQISASETADFSINVKDSYEITVQTYSKDVSYDYDNFQRDSSLMIWSIYGQYKTDNIGYVNVNWVHDDILRAITTLRELDFRINYPNIFPGQITATTVNQHMDEVIEFMTGNNNYQKDLNQTPNIKNDTNKLSGELITFINGLTIQGRGSEPRPAFDIPNIAKACSQGRYWPGLFDNFEYAFKYFEIKQGVSLWRILGNSLIIAVAAVFFQWFLSAAAAFAVAKFIPKKLGNIITVFFIITMMIPSIVYIVSLYKIVAENNFLNNLLMVIIPGVPNATAFVLFKGYFSSLPDDLYEASKIDGSNAFSTYFRVYVPLSLPMFGVVALLVFLGNWNDLLWPSMVLKDTEFQTFSIIINRMLGTVSTGVGVGYPVTLALSLLSIIPTIIVFLIFEKQLVKGIAFGGVKG